ncbi:DNA-binding response regulator [Shewanella sp. Choline-02u-19]|uniref:response regulator n=1 Tax=unclassified Shewanella TaxID=196818 RepID=UPI000C34DE8E|nr:MULTISPECIES: response regulator [unclassified Shewanella]PKG56026.1 DNA-binding response regulator [Shewanella sp. GutDb-MelDb]PKG73985.1 DNA-binding response regulator [Shewanella sp. GutCb]PKH54981.1 DNA-binding response regulator [Shewanella sp. Bg11-22]PKI26753.1 DNA-binding response regulator [Shewanella sp. Choline-02u-19]
MRILLVEDDIMIGEAMQQSLIDASYAIDWVNNGQSALDSLATHNYDCVLLDLGLPGLDGLVVLAKIREKYNLAVIVITARDTLKSRIDGLDSGADDYVIKPFDMSELLARMRAVIRRRSGNSVPTLESSQLILNPATNEVSFTQTYADKMDLQSTSILLSNREFSLLRALLMRPGAILSKADLEEKIYGWGNEVESNAIEYLIHSLRKKLGAITIKNIRGVGWMVLK